MLCVGCDEMNLWTSEIKATDTTRETVVFPKWETIPELNPTIKIPNEELKPSELVTVVFPSGETIKIPNEELKPSELVVFPSEKLTTTMPVKPINKKQYYYNITPEKALIGGLIILVCIAAIISLQKIKRKVKVVFKEAEVRATSENKKLPGLKKVNKFDSLENKQKIELTINPVVRIADENDNENDNECDEIC